MKILISTILFCLWACAIDAQIPEGTYAYSDPGHQPQTLIFYKNGRVYFDLWNKGCLVNNYKGAGTYHLTKKRIWIKPQLPIRPAYYLSTTPAQPSDKVCFYITDSLKTPIAGASVLIMREKRTISGVASDINGVALLYKKYIQIGDTVTVAFLGYHNAKYLLDPSADQHVALLYVPNEATYSTYLSNYNKGYTYKLTPGSIKINFKDATRCSSPDWWVEFKKVTEPDKTTTSNISSR